MGFIIGGLVGLVVGVVWANEIKIFVSNLISK